MSHYQTNHLYAFFAIFLMINPNDKSKCEGMRAQTHTKKNHYKNDDLLQNGSKIS
jgi:hypothetical protein